MKIDANCDEQVDWQEYLTYVLTSMKEKETMANLYKKKTLPKQAKLVHKMYKYQKTLDTCVAILWLPVLRRENIRNTIFYKTVNMEYGRYLTVSRDGVLNVWTKDLCHERRIELETNKIWVTDACLLLNINALAIATTKDKIIVYELVGFQIGKPENCNFVERTVSVPNYSI